MKRTPVPFKPSKQRMATLVSPADLEVNEKRTLSSWFVHILGKVGFYKKLGVFCWTLFVSAFQAFDTYDHFRDGSTLDAIKIVELGMFFVFFCILLLSPTAIYKIQNNAEQMLAKRNLVGPLYPILLILPAIVNTVIILVSLSREIDVGSIDGLLYPLVLSLLDFLVLLFMFLPNFLTGTTTSTFIQECQHFQKNILTAPMTEPRRLLMLFRSIKEGCKFVLFIIFVGNTLMCIGVAYIIAMDMNGCMPESQMGLTYTMFLQKSILCLMYYGFCMEDCYEEFMKIADTLRCSKPFG